jgi:hypothetical protein
MRGLGFAGLGRSPRLLLFDQFCQAHGHLGGQVQGHLLIAKGGKEAALLAVQHAATDRRITHAF